MAFISLADLGQEHFPTVEQFYNEHFPHSPWRTGTLGKFAKQSECAPTGFFFVERAQVIGLALGRKDFQNPEIYLLTALLVHPEHRGAGLSSALLERFFLATQKIDDIQKIRLHFRANNNLGRFYARFGFSIVETDEVYSNGEKKVLMEKVLRPEAAELPDLSPYLAGHA